MKNFFCCLIGLLIALNGYSQIYIDGTQSAIIKDNPNLDIKIFPNSDGSNSLIWTDKKNNIIVVDTKNGFVKATYIIPDKDRFINELSVLTKDALKISDTEWLYYVEKYAVRIRVVYLEFLNSQSIQFTLGNN